MGSTNKKKLLDKYTLITYARNVTGDGTTGLCTSLVNLCFIRSVKEGVGNRTEVRNNADPDKQQTGYAY